MSCRCLCFSWFLGRAGSPFQIVLLHLGVVVVYLCAAFPPSTRLVGRNLFLPPNTEHFSFILSQNLLHARWIPVHSAESWRQDRSNMSLNSMQSFSSQLSNRPVQMFTTLLSIAICLVFHTHQSLLSAPGLTFHFSCPSVLFHRWTSQNWHRIL